MSCLVVEKLNVNGKFPQRPFASVLNVHGPLPLNGQKWRTPLILCGNIATMLQISNFLNVLKNAVAHARAREVENFDFEHCFSPQNVSCNCLTLICNVHPKCREDLFLKGPIIQSVAGRGILWLSSSVTEGKVLRAHRMEIQSAMLAGFHEGIRVFGVLVARHHAIDIDFGFNALQTHDHLAHYLNTLRRA